MSRVQESWGIHVRAEKEFHTVVLCLCMMLDWVVVESLLLHLLHAQDERVARLRRSLVSDSPTEVPIKLVLLRWQGKLNIAKFTHLLSDSID
jgi:hypothetical protein